MHRIEAVVELPREHVGPQVGPLDRHAFQLEAASGAEVVVGDEIARQLSRFLLLGAGQRLGRDDLVLLLDLLALEHHVEQERLELVGELFRLGRAAALLDHVLPFRQVRVELRRLGEKLDPPVEQLVIELLGVGDLWHVFPGLAQHFPSGHHVLRRLQRERLGELRRLGLHELAEQLLFLLVVVDDRLRRERVLLIYRVQKHACERVIVPRRNRVVLVIVAACAADGEAEKPARDDVDAVVAFVGPRDLDGAVVVVPRAEPEQPERGQHLHPHVVVEQIGSQLRFHELVVRQVVVERFDNPVAIQVGVRVRVVAAKHRIEAAVVVFPVARDVEPEPAPGLAVLRRREQPIDHLRERVG